MNNANKRLAPIWLMFLVSVIVSLTACSKSPNEQGLWVSNEDQGSIEFKPEGRVVVIDNMDLELTGSYQFKDDNTVLFELTGPNIFDSNSTDTTSFDVTAKYEFQGDELRLSIETDEEATVYYRR